MLNLYIYRKKPKPFLLLNNSPSVNFLIQYNQFIYSIYKNIYFIYHILQISNELGDIYFIFSILYITIYITHKIYVIYYICMYKGHYISIGGVYVISEKSGFSPFSYGLISFIINKKFSDIFLS